MEILGHIGFKEIFYCNVRLDQNWFTQLPVKNWIVFTIANDEDDTFITDVAIKCLDKEVSCICCAGQLESKTGDYFGKEMIVRNIKKDDAGELGDFDTSPMITFHRNFSEGFWFATTIANSSIEDDGSGIDKVVCIDMTTDSVRNYLRDLIGRFNSGELPSDSEYEEPLYDPKKN